MARDTLRIGGACGFWGEAPFATAQLLANDAPDVLVYDYLAEITLSIMARARSKDPGSGYATDFLTEAMAPNLRELARQGTKVLSNAGGMNPGACAKALQRQIEEQGLDLTVGIVEGDDLMGQIDALLGEPEMFSGDAFPSSDSVLSANAYLGAQPIAAVLDAGADIVITGRCADSALTLAACMHAFGWKADQFNLLAAGSLAGHLLECGPQATGGNFTDWESVPDRANIGYPIADIRSDGTFVIEKPQETGGLVTRETVGEQMLYEIGDPGAYILPDVVCDFTHVSLKENHIGQVEVSGARGHSPTGYLKVSVTFLDGFRGGQILNFNGRDAKKKGRAYAEDAVNRAKSRLAGFGLADFDHVHIETFGGRLSEGDFEEVAVTAAVRHKDQRAVALFLKELVGGALATPPGLHFFTGSGRPKPSPVVALFSCLVDAGLPNLRISVNGATIPFPQQSAFRPKGKKQAAIKAPPTPESHNDITWVPLETLAVARSGDKGNAVNIGVMARSPDYLPWIWAGLTPEAIRSQFKEAVQGPIERFYLPGIDAMNILMHNALGGGGIASLRNDAQGKGYAQRLLAMQIAVPSDLLSDASEENR